MLLDPTGEFVLVPDLGADLLRVFTWNEDSVDDVLIEQIPFPVKSGSGPRHAVFWEDDGYGSDTYLFVLGELANTITSYKVSYPAHGSIDFTEVDSQDTFGGAPIPEGAHAGELQISPHNRFLVLSNREDLTFHLNTYGDDAGSEPEASDSLATYAIGENGKLAFKQIWPAGGLHPRHFAMNRAGDMVAVGLKNSCRLVILCGDVETGLIGMPLADISVGRYDGSAGPNMIIWDE